MTDSAFKSLTEVERIFKTLVWDTAITAGELALAAYVPFFALPGIKQITNAVIEFVSNQIYKKLVLIIDVSAIKLVNSVHQKEFDDAMVKLKIVSRDKGPESKEYKEEIERAKTALAKFVRYGATIE